MRFDKTGDVDWQLDRLLNKGLDFQDNMRGGFIEFTTTMGEEEVLQHNLGYVPIGFLVIMRTGDVRLWATVSQLSRWNGEHLFLQSSAPNHLVRLFVM